MRIIHFAPDDKFIPFVQTTFEAAFPGRNHYRVPITSGGQLRFTRPGDDVRFVPLEYWTSDELANELRGFDCLIVHFMTSQFAEAIKRAPDDLFVYWVGWGGDYDFLIQPYLGKLVLPETGAVMGNIIRRRRKAQLWSFPAKLLRNPVRVARDLKTILSAPRPGALIREISSRIDLVWVSPEEARLLEKALPDLPRDYHRICYYSVEDTFGVGPEKMAGPDILIGNSATATNNHIELFDLLGTLDLGDRRLIAPLSYGDQDYADEIERIGRQRFGERFVPLRQYMSLEEYHETIRTCGTLVMNHVRQQAGSTIAAALYKGARVFLRDENPLGAFYRRLGLRLYSVQDDLSAGPTVLGPAGLEEAAEHRRILEDLWSRDVAIAAAVALREHVRRKRGPGE